MLILEDVEQGSPEWFAEKCGKPGASSFNKIVTMKGEPSKQREGYLYQLAAEAVTGVKESGYMSQAMGTGIRREPIARAYYELVYGVTVKQVGVIYPDKKKRYLCSPDGIFDDTKNPKKMYGLEIKNPLPKTQVSYLLKGKLPSEYFQQVQGSMLITGFERWDFFSYCPGLPPLIIEVERDEALLPKLAEELDRFCDDLEETIEKLRKI